MLTLLLQKNDDLYELVVHMTTYTVVRKWNFIENECYHIFYFFYQVSMFNKMPIRLEISVSSHFV